MWLQYGFFWFCFRKCLFYFSLSLSPPKNQKLILRTLEWWDAALQKRQAWALFVLLLSTLVCCQSTELIWAFFVSYIVQFHPPSLPLGTYRCLCRGEETREEEGQCHSPSGGGGYTCTVTGSLDLFSLVIHKQRLHCMYLWYLLFTMLWGVNDCFFVVVLFPY